MNQKAMQTLEYNKIIDKLAGFACSTLGKEHCKALAPMKDIDAIQSALTQTSDALKRIYQKGSLSFSGIYDIRGAIKRLAIGSSLSVTELLSISSLLDVTARVKAFSKKEDTDVPDDSLDPMFHTLNPLNTINKEIKRCIISEEEIADDASPELKNIRRKIKSVNGQIQSQLTSILNSSSTRTYLQDHVITMRNGRYCVPVKQEYRGQVQGMIHDQSSSGSTLFIEPMAVVRLNNDLRELDIKEQEEIEIILAKLSAEAAEHLEELNINFDVLITLDFIFAKASLSKSLKCSEPAFREDGIINIKDGRHPLLDPKTVVPIDIHIGKTFDLLIITGPNTGGKTVSLKMTGLLTLMGQAGLHIPAFDGSELSVFEEVYADIGDEQSIEQSLSTFSSHMKNIVHILEQANDRSLVLFDELCAGTDPVEGAALAISILTHLHSLKTRTIATTHYSELKLFALSSERVENACCEFNVETLSPTYRLLIGIPGKSNAFAISGKLGLPDYIITDARSRINTNDIAFEDIISDLENSKITIEKEHAEISAYKKEIEELKKRLEKKQENLDDRKERILREANEDARKILVEAKEYADQAIKDFHKMSSDLSIRDMEQTRNKVREKLKDTEGKLSYRAKSTPSRKTHSAKDFRLGERVKVLSMGLEGTVSSLPNAKGDLHVQMGILRSQVNIRDLIIIDEPTITGVNIHKTPGSANVSKSSTLSSEINLIGKNVDEALASLDKYLDDAYISHLSQVRVVHGKGTGTLRNAVHAHVKRLKYVKSYRLGSFGEGDTGVTIVEFKS